jgi:hypothetical protein
MHCINSIPQLHFIRCLKKTAFPIKEGHYNSKIALTEPPINRLTATNSNPNK